MVRQPKADGTGQALCEHLRCHRIGIGAEGHRQTELSVGTEAVTRANGLFDAV
jgi:hypothetical protein